MIENLQKIIRSNLIRVLHRSVSGAEVDMAAPLVDGLGLSSLDLVVLITAACKEAAVPMTALTEQDIAEVRTGADLVRMLAAKLAAQGGQHAMA